MGKKTTEQFKKEVYDLVGDEYEVLGEYTGYNEKIKFKHICEACNNHEFEKRPGKFLSGQHCPICSKENQRKKQTKTTDQFKKEVYDLVGDEYEVLGEYTNGHDNIKMKHNSDICKGEPFYIQPTNFLQRLNCPLCSRINQQVESRKTTDQFKKEVYDLVGDEYEVLGEYINKESHIQMKHKKCNKIYSPTPHNFLQGKSRCIYCSCTGPSKEEQEVVEFIKSIINENEIKTSDRDILNGKELDILIDSKKSAFEYDGLYWHSEKHGRDKNYHLNKTNECDEAGIRLYHIFSDEWTKKQEIVKSKISYILNVTDNPRIYARKCIVKELTTKKDIKAKGEFLNNNHIQGNDNSSIKLGLYYNDQLVSVMTFCKPRKSLGQTTNVYDYELSRFASDINYIVVGAFSKLFKYFERNYKWNKLITYADKRWSNGNVYIKNGWTHLRDSKPNYWYTDGGLIRLHRYTFRKQVLKQKFPDIYDDNLTEFEIMDKTPYMRIWDCGNMVFEYDR